MAANDDEAKARIVELLGEKVRALTSLKEFAKTGMKVEQFAEETKYAAEQAVQQFGPNKSKNPLMQIVPPVALNVELEQALEKASADLATAEKQALKEAAAREQALKISAVRAKKKK